MFSSIRLLALGTCLITGLIPLSAFPGALRPDAVDVAMQRHDVGTFYVNGALQGYGDLELLVDTGASYLVINENILSQLKKSGKARHSRDLHGTMADGSSRLTPVYRLSGLRLGERCWVNDIEAAVIPGNTRPILGMNVLSRLAPFTFSAEPARLQLNQCQALAPDELADSTMDPALP